MSKQTQAVVSRHTTDHGSFGNYLLGYLLSLVFTISAYLIVEHRNFTNKVIYAVITVLALLQFFVQLVFFLHLGKETKPRWKLLVFILMITIVLILVFGSIWIMSNLNYRMTPHQINNYMNNQGGGF